IISATDAIMVARGDLGIEIPYEKVPFVQKDIIKKCLVLATPVIVATQMLESLLDKIQPNRSEISDIANAVLDGADAVMLSGETANGEHSVLAVETMVKVVVEAENSSWQLDYVNDKEVLKQFKPDDLHADKGNYLSRQLCTTASDISRELEIDLIAAISRSGRTASLLSCHRPHSPIFVFVKERYLLTQLNLIWGVKAFLYGAEEEGFDNRVDAVVNILRQQHLIQSGNTIIFIASTPTSTEQPTNVLKITNVI
ncbi:MAG: pyruvate kinase, partial [Chitinophagaceae bacterium]